MRLSSPRRWCGLRFCIPCASWCWPRRRPEPQLRGCEQRRPTVKWIRGWSTVGEARLSRLFLFFEDRIELCAGHLQFVRMFVDPLGQGIIFCRRPTSFEFGAVLPQAVQLEVEGIFEIGEFGRDDCRLGEDGGDKDDAVGFSEDEI